MAHILVVEADADALEIIERGLSQSGYEVSSTADPEKGVELARELDVDLLLLDMGLATRTGLEVLQRIRETDPRLPIFALSNLEDTGTVVIGLDAGVDEYVTKPVSVPKLAARIKARLRNSVGNGALNSGSLTLNLATHKVSFGGRDIELSAREQGLLATFIRHEGKVLSRRELLKIVWELDFDPGSNVVQVYIRTLRKKLGASTIETVRGRGYRFVAPRLTEPGSSGR
jgi:DNA-binding response OmpR family regulator